MSIQDMINFWPKDLKPLNDPGVMVRGKVYRARGTPETWGCPEFFLVKLCNTKAECYVLAKKIKVSHPMEIIHSVKLLTFYEDPRHPTKSKTKIKFGLYLFIPRSFADWVNEPKKIRGG